MQISYSFAIRKNRILDYYKPNEDYLLTGDNLFIISDGVSRDLIENKYPLPSPSSEVSKILCHVINSHLKNSRDHNLIKNEMLSAILAGNEEIKIYNNNQEYKSFLPGAVIIIAIILNSKLYMAYVGDCLGYLIRNKKIIKLFNPQTTLIREHGKEFSKEIIRDTISNNSKHPYGYGILNGKKGVVDFIEFKEFDLKNEDHIILASDGFDQLFSNLNEINIEMLDVNFLIDKAEKLETSKSDDKSIISIKVTNI